MDHVTAYTDGACIGNPGPGGWAALLIRGHKRTEITGGVRLTTNNRMEIVAAIAALETLEEPSRVKVHTDSMYVVNTMERGWWKKWVKNGWRRKVRKTKELQPVKNVDLWQRILELCAVHEVRFHWVRGHNGDVNNERCDYLAENSAHLDGLPADDVYEALANAPEKIEMETCLSRQLLLF